MTDEFVEAFVALREDIHDLKTSEAGVVIDNIPILWDEVIVSGVMSLTYTLKSGLESTVTVSDNFLTPEYGADFTESVFTSGLYDDVGYLRLDYGRLDYDRLSHYKGGVESDVEVTIT